ncbi:MAG: CRISPR system precrRNA processing endoribonuclease RAMP protein Cas6 [Caldilineaceae bacterium]|nr:CRISPR system precrRNA processing endoribonuclease RAMP protein Cas6 [Caldilineaceae bacterium]
MLLAFKLLVKTSAPAHVPPHLGRAVYAAALARLGEVDPATARAVHDGDGPKPLTCSGLLGAPPRGPLSPDHMYAVRYTALTAEVTAALSAGFLDAPPAELDLDGNRLQVVETLCDSGRDGWTGRAEYAALAAQHLAQGGEQGRSVTLEFASPTTFKSGGVHVPAPLPNLVFGSLVERWNAFSPVALSPDVRRFGAEMVALSRYQLRSAAVGYKGEGLRIGGVGQATYTALSGDRYWLGVLHLLAAFAVYSGVGSQTTSGMGQVRQAR